MNTAKLIESVSGWVTMSDGSRREAWKNTYKATVFNADGTFAHVEETRVEFRLDTNANAVQGRRFRKTSPKQAATFAA